VAIPTTNTSECNGGNVSLEKFDPNCKGCRPAMVDAKTMQRMPEDSKEMRAILLLWEHQSIETKQAWHDFTCLNSRDYRVMVLVNRFADAMQEVLKALESKGN
jgi:hypothetical protein